MQIALIIGCARSGTTILGELLAAHEGVQYIYEVWEKGGLGAGDSHRLTERHATPEVGREIRDWFEARDDGRMIVEKCPRNALRVPSTKAIFPEAKLIHIVRDGRDVACSLRPGIGGAEWRHLKPENWRDLMKLPWAERCACAWSEVISVALADLKSADHLTVRYEDLVRDPRAEAARILKYLGLAPSAAVDRFAANIQDSTRESFVPERYEL